MTYGLYNTIFVIAVILAVVFLIASVILFFAWKIPKAVKELRSLTAEKRE